MPKTTKEIKNRNSFDWKTKMWYCQKCKLEICQCNDLWFSQSEVDELIDDAINSIISELDKEHNEQLEKIRKELNNFLDALESQTGDWDRLCDCTVSSEVKESNWNGYHDSNCMTVKIRKDVEKLLNKFYSSHGLDFGKDIPQLDAVSGEGSSPSKPDNICAKCGKPEHKHFLL